MWATPLTDATGAAITTPTPLLFGVMQDVSLDISKEVKSLYGSLTFPVDVAGGKGKVTGKARFASINAALLNAIFFGATATAGIHAVKYDTVGAAIPTTPFTITPTPPSSGVWEQDLGVVVVSTGARMTRVTGTPSAGQYAVSAGVYTFASADNVSGLSVYINYAYTATSTSAAKTTVVNQPMGLSPTFQVDFYAPRNGKSFFYRLPNCVGTKLAMATKLDDFTIPEFDFEAFANASGNVIVPMAMTEA